MDAETDDDALQSTFDDLGHLFITPSRLTFQNDFEVGSGGYGEVWLAKLDGSSKVAVKQLRIVQPEGIRARMARRLARELKIWAKVQHPNVLKLVGYYLSENYDCAQLVSPYLENGNILKYIKEAQPGIQARLGFIQGITSGMAYLHGCDPPICHGDIKPANVLVNEVPDAVLCDLGLATFVGDSGPSSGLTTSRSIKGSFRYMSPELSDDEAKHTLESDVWAWACTTFEILTDAIPYPDRKGDIGILGAVLQGESPGSMEFLRRFAQQFDIPSRSILVTLQTLLPECWSRNPGERPSSARILNRLSGVDLGTRDQPSAQQPRDNNQTDDHSAMTERVTAAPPTLSESKLDEEFDQLGPRSRSGDTRALEAALDQGFTKSELIKRYLTVEKSPFTSGPYADLYLGRWEPPYDPKGIDVMVKVIRMGRIEDGEHFVAENKKCGENLERTVAVWQKMDCPRITPCIGYIEGFQNDVIPATVSLRRRNNLIDYTTYTNPQADRLNLLSQVVEGLAYLHKFEPDPIFHLDLKPDNILVTEEGSAELCDVGYTKALEDVSTGFSTGPNPGGAYPYLSPEVLMGDSFDQMTAGADIYAIGSIILYLLSGKRPWYRLKGKGLLIITITRGIWPKPVDHPMEGSEEAVQKTWDLVKRCLNMSAEERPPAQEVLAELLGIEAMGGVGPPID